MTSERGQARSAGLSYQRLLDSDTRTVNPVLRMDQPAFLGDDDKPASQYFSRDVHDLEMERIWLRCWQFACREEHIPNVGDTEVYDIGDYSVLLVRVAPDQIKAYPNACLHRGRQLREAGGSVTELRCPFHGYAWNLDGSLKQIPSEWDFPHIDKDNFDLSELGVGTWGGFVFVNFDRNAVPFEEYLGDLPKHFKDWRLEDRYVEAHVAKIIRCNWKVVQEAFSEAFHVVATHPQLLAASGDENSQYDVFGNFSRAITPNGTPSPHIQWDPTEQQMLDAMLDRGLDDDPIVELPDGVGARAMASAAARERLRPVIGDEFADRLCDAELSDSIYYTLFPNFHPWGAFNRIVYRFRPYGNDPEMSIMETLFLSPFTGERPPPAPVHWLGPDDSYLDATELGNLARVFNQDIFNLPRVQRGLHSLALRKPGVSLALYQETKIRHFYKMYQEHMAKP